MVKHFGGGCKSQRPFAYRKVLYLIGLKYTISFLFGQNQELTQDLLIEKHGLKAFWHGVGGRASLPKKVLYLINIKYAI